jgi:hypothetical protein
MQDTLTRNVPQGNVRERGVTRVLLELKESFSGRFEAIESIRRLQDGMNKMRKLAHVRADVEYDCVGTASPDRGFFA